MPWNRDKYRSGHDYVPDRIRFETVRDILAVALALGLIIVALQWALPKYLIEEGGAYTVSEKEAETEEFVEVVVDPDGSGRFQPTSLNDGYVFAGSLSVQQESESQDSDFTILLGNRNAAGDGFASLVQIDLATKFTPPPVAFDPGQELPFEQVQFGERSGRYLSTEEQPYDFLTWVENNRDIYIQSRGVSQADLFAIAEGLLIFEPVEVEEEEAPDDGAEHPEAAEDVFVLGVTARASVTAGLEPVLSESISKGESTVTIDTYAVPGSAAAPVTVSSSTLRDDFRPEFDAMDPLVSLISLRATESSYFQSGLLRWRERDGLVIELSAEGFSRSELVVMANTLTELTEGQVNQRVRPTVDPEETIIATPAPAPGFDDSTLGTLYALAQPVGTERPPVNGQVPGAIIALGTIEGSDLSGFYWRRTDEDYAYCVGIAGFDMDAVFCVRDAELDLTLARMGSFDILTGMSAGQRLHVWRVPPGTSVASFTVDGVARRQYPQQGIVAFLAPVGEYVEVRATDVDGGRL